MSLTTVAGSPPRSKSICELLGPFDCLQPKSWLNALGAGDGPLGSDDGRERLGYVLECFLRSGALASLETLVVRGEPRPEDDPHVAETPESDPVFVVWGRRS